MLQRRLENPAAETKIEFFPVTKGEALRFQIDIENRITPLGIVKPEAGHVQKEIG